MAFNAAAIGIVRISATASDANGGFFNPLNANFDNTGSATNGNTTNPLFSATNYAFVAGDVGARVFIKSGTNSIPGWYTISSVAGGVATLKASANLATLFDGTSASGPNTATGIATVASPTVLTWGLDYSNQDAAQLSFTDMVIGVTTTQFTTATTANFIGKHMIGNYINVTAGSGFLVQRVEVVSTSGTTPAIGNIATCDKSLGTTASTGGVGALGGAMSTWGGAEAVCIGGNDVFYQTGTYTTTSASSNVSGGIVSVGNAGSVTNFGVREGFGAIPKDMGTRPTLKIGTGSSLTAFAASANFTKVNNIVIDGNSGTSITGLVVSGARCAAYKVKAQNCTVIGISNTTQAATITQCEATGCSGTAAFSSTVGTQFVNCEAYGNTIHGFVGCVNVIGCISSGNSGTTDGFQTLTNTDATYVGCVAYGNGRHGFNASNAAPELYQNCLSEANSGYGFTATAGVNAGVQLLNCGGYNNTSGQVNTTQLPVPAIAYVNNVTGTFFNGAGSGDLSLNNLPLQGGLARAAGYPGLMPRGTSTGYIDIGAVQSQNNRPIGQTIKVASIGTY